MKYVISWTGRDVATSEADAKRLMAIFGKWTPSEGATFHQFVGRVDNNGGFAVVETENPTDILRDVAKFEPWLRYEVVPVVDIQDLAAANDEAIAFRDSIS
jgi:Domain of unknown function (DUF3303)